MLIILGKIHEKLKLSIIQGKYKWSSKLPSLLFFHNNPTSNFAINYNLQSSQSLFWTPILTNYVKLKKNYDNNRLRRTRD